MEARYRVSSLPPENDKSWLCVTAVRVTARYQSVLALPMAPRDEGPRPASLPANESLKVVVSVQNPGCAAHLETESARQTTTWPVTYVRNWPAVAKFRYLAGDAAATYVSYSMLGPPATAPFFVSTRITPFAARLP